jgi:hypothetical protein
MMKLFHNSTPLLPTNPGANSVPAVQNTTTQAPQPQKVQTQFLLASAQIEDRKSKDPQIHHPSPLNSGKDPNQYWTYQNWIAAPAVHHPSPLHPSPLGGQQQQQQLSSPASTAAALALQQQQQQNANPQLKRTQPMAVPVGGQATGAQVPGMPPFNLMNYVSCFAWSLGI